MIGPDSDSESDLPVPGPGLRVGLRHGGHRDTCRRGRTSNHIAEPRGMANSTTWISGPGPGLPVGRSPSPSPARPRCPAASLIYFLIS